MKRRKRRRINKKTEAMSYSSLKLPIFLILSSLLHAALGEEIICENLPTSMCAFSISASGKRCLLETANVAGEYTCRTSAVEVEGIVNHVESDECVAACGVDRKTVGISSDAMMEPGFAAKLCSPACLDYCPNILDLYFNLAAGEGAFLPDLCDAQRTNPHRSMMEMFSSGGAPEPASETAPGPVSDSSAPALAPAAM
ncbi:hypothetical protein HID58_014324 [Brassica napus]|uniref:PAR1 protein n=3 Tax=Brassica TaxID=3705 RepID=A0ABQ8DHU0_BRANA|nr:hypothetical protein HID58_014324 [Brassica napus]